MVWFPMSGAIGKLMAFLISIIIFLNCILKYNNKKKITRKEFVGGFPVTLNNYRENQKMTSLKYLPS